MQIVLTLHSDNKIILPIASNAVVQGFIYNALRSDGAFSCNLHENGKIFSGRQYKLFNFSEIKGKYEVIEKTIAYTSNISFVVRGADAYFIQLLLSYFVKGRELTFGRNSVTVADVKLKNTEVYDNSIRVKTISPITVYITESSGYTRYYSPEDKEFYSGIVRNAHRKFTAFFGNDDGFQLTVKPCEDCRFIKRATRFKDTFITAWHGEFLLEGTPKTLDFLYKTGLGSKNSQGFGMIELIK